MAPNGGSLSLSLQQCSSFSFDIEKVLVCKFDVLFKCTAAKKLRTLITLQLKALCD